MARTAKRSLTAADAALTVGGVWLVGMGLYFIVLRPPLLPEDERFLGTSLQAASEALPRLTAWLDHVVEVLGGFAAGLGAVVLWLVACQSPPRARLGAAIGGLAACGWMAATNVALGSDFRWVLGVAVTSWLAAVALLLAERRSSATGSR